MTGEILLAVHLLGAVVWVGGLFFAWVVLRPSLGALQPADRMALNMGVFRKFFLVTWHAMPIVLLTGYAMVALVYGGFANVGWNVHVMHLLGLIMAVVFVAIFFGPWRKLRLDGDIMSVERIRKLVAANLILGLVTVVIAALNG